MAFAIGACTPTTSAPTTTAPRTTAGGPPPNLSAAQAAAYCNTLTQTYAEYVGTIGGSLGGTFSGGERADIDARVAIAQCQQGNTAAGIPVLQQKLRDAKVPVPPPPAG
ncbi:MAG: hypothetical protein Q8L22_05125 [Reyranella sp.]|nr:hypothetical protein [Reyranella sp.]